MLLLFALLIWRLSENSLHAFRFLACTRWKITLQNRIVSFGSKLTVCLVILCFLRSLLHYGAFNQRCEELKLRFFLCLVLNLLAVYSMSRVHSRKMFSPDLPKSEVHYKKEGLLTGTEGSWIVTQHRFTDKNTPVLLSASAQ